MTSVFPGKASDYVNNQYYKAFLGGGSNNFRNNPQANRQLLMEQMYERVVSEMCMNRFKWIGLPDEIDERFLELTLFRNALSVFYFDREYSKYMALRGAGHGKWNMYDNPTSFLVTGNASFVSKDIDAKDCVPIWSNYLRTPDWDIVMIYKTKLAEIDRTIEIAVKNARRSKVIIADQDQRLSATQINNALDRGDSAIFVNSMGASIVEQMTAVDLGPHHEQIEKLQIAKTRLWNECMGLIGLNNANQDKKERLVAAEVSANDEQVNNMKHVNLNERKKACRLINEKYDLNVDVKFHVEIPTVDISTGGII